MFLELAILIVLVLLNGVLAMAELAIVSARTTRLRVMAEKGRIALVHPEAVQVDAIKAALEPYVQTALKQIGAKGIDANAAYDALKAEVEAVEAGK